MNPVIRFMLIVVLFVISTAGSAAALAYLMDRWFHG